MSFEFHTDIEISVGTRFNELFTDTEELYTHYEVWTGRIDEEGRVVDGNSLGWLSIEELADIAVSYDQINHNSLYVRGREEEIGTGDWHHNDWRGGDYFDFPGPPEIEFHTDIDISMETSFAELFTDEDDTATWYQIWTGEMDEEGVVQGSLVDTEAGRGWVQAEDLDELMVTGDQVGHNTIYVRAHSPELGLRDWEHNDWRGEEFFEFPEPWDYELTIEQSYAIEDTPLDQMFSITPPSGVKDDEIWLQVKVDGEPLQTSLGGGWVRGDQLDQEVFPVADAGKEISVVPYYKGEMHEDDEVSWEVRDESPGSISGEIVLDNEGVDRDVEVTVEANGEAVTLEILEGETGAEYIIEGLEAGNYEVSAEVTGDAVGAYEIDNGVLEDITVEAGEVNDGNDFNLVSLPGSIAGTVSIFDVEGEADPEAAIEITVSAENGETYEYIIETADDDGQSEYAYLLEGVYAGTYTVTASVDGYELAEEQQVQVGAGEEVEDIDLTVTAIDDPEYTVTFIEDEEVEDWTVTVYSDEERTEEVGSADAGDEEPFYQAAKDLKDGEYWFTVELDGYQDYEGDFEVDGQEKTVDFELDALASDLWAWMWEAEYDPEEEDYLVTFDIDNDGAVDTENLEITISLDDEEIYFDDETVISAGETYEGEFWLGEYYDLENLVPGQEYTLTLEVQDDYDSDEDSETFTAFAEPAYFAVVSVDADPIDQGEEASVSVDIENTGGEEGTQDIVLTIVVPEADDIVVTEEDFTIGAGETETVEFTDIDTTGLDAGDYDIQVATDDETETFDNALTVEAVVENLTVDTTSPEDGDTDVEVDTDITVTFDQNIQLLDTGWEHITLSGTALSEDEVSVEDNVLTITPDEALAYDTEMTVEVGEDAVGWEGDEDVKLEEAYDFSFTTEQEPVTYTVTFSEVEEVDDWTVTVYADEERTEEVGSAEAGDEEPFYQAAKDLKDGEYWFTVELDGYQDYEGDFEVDGQEKTVDFELDELTSDLWAWMWEAEYDPQEEDYLVTFDIDNDGAVDTENLEITISLDDEEIYSDDETVISAGETYEGEFWLGEYYDLENLVPGQEYTLTLEVEDDYDSDEDSETFTAFADPAYFAVVSVDADPIDQGEEASVSVDIENTGGEEGTQDIVLTIVVPDAEDIVVTEEDFTIGAGDTGTVEFTDIDTTGLDVGDYDIQVETDDETETFTDALTVVDVEEPYFQIETLELEEFWDFQTGTANVQVVNQGQEGVRDISLTVDGDVIEVWEDVELSKGERWNQEVDIDPDELDLDTGWYNLELDTEDDQESLYFQIKESPEYITVFETTPEKGDKNVSIDTDIEVIFDQDIQLLDAGEIEITADEESFDFTASVTDDVLTITPDEDFAYDTEITVVINTDAVAWDLNPGVTLEEDFSFIFTTEEGPVVDDITVDGPDSLTIPSEGVTMGEYSAVVFDQFGDEMPDEEVIWSLEDLGDLEGISIDENTGEVTVSTEAYEAFEEGDSFTVVATSETDEEIYETMEVDLELEDLVVTTVNVDGPGTILIPEEGETEVVTYEAEVLDQYGAQMEEEVTWSLDQEVDGVTIDDGVITVTHDADPDEEFTVIATSVSDEDVTGEFEVSLTDEAPAVDSIVVEGDETVVVPSDGENSYTYTATVFDQFGDEMPGEDVSWILEDLGDLEGISINDIGLVTVSADAYEAFEEGDSFTVVATSETDSTVTETMAVDLELEELRVDQVEIVEGPDSMEIPPSDEEPNTATYTATVFDQYGAEMDEDVIWSLEEEITGITIDDGVVTVSTDAYDEFEEGDTFTVVATSETDSTVTETMAVDLELEELRVDQVEIVEGPDSMEIPPSDEEPNTATYTATVFDQYGAEMDEDVIWSLEEEITGITIDDGVVTVSTDAYDEFEEGDTFTVVATSETDSTVTETMAVDLELEELRVDQVEIVEGPDSMEIPPSDEEPNTATYTATVFDQYGAEMDEDVIWSLEEEITGITIDDGVVTVSTDAYDEFEEGDTFTVVATSETDSTVTETMAVDLELEELRVDQVEIVEGPDSMEIPSDDEPNTGEFTVSVLDQYGTEMEDVEVTWNILEDIDGVSIEDGTVTVTAAAYEEADSFTVEVSANGETDTQVVDLELEELRVDDFSLFVEDINAGEEPVLEFTDAVDQYGADLEGDYTADITINGDEYIDVTLSFSEGAATFEDATSIEEANDYTATATIGDITNDYTFTVEQLATLDITDITIDPEEPTEGDEITVSGNVFVDIADAQNVTVSLTITDDESEVVFSAEKAWEEITMGESEEFEFTWDEDVEVGDYEILIEANADNAVEVTETESVTVSEVPDFNVIEADDEPASVSQTLIGTDDQIDVFVFNFESDGNNAFAKFAESIIQNYNYDDGDIILLVDQMDSLDEVSHVSTDSVRNVDEGAIINFFEDPGDPDQSILIEDAEVDTPFGATLQNVVDVRFEVEKNEVIEEMGLNTYIEELIAA
ncbi:hypothetical protein Dthio_PD0098 [Desulfonatronospira thiodismutans ASO3-1]|uniref:SbsA Ig-like domain-containing protein n=1 Tax=Desulfonatronospira thiodismutans ASO3-1 TaxID=555779 RepID=D6SV44_9BACT|nr:Ig-like domain-containing protein [Desulfonatronospira thiodismutans]EFI32800.1 hypothetical protein Dthio_PD0098 [Desulfonatronospira thiodismutans ASO3-1]